MNNSANEQLVASIRIHKKAKLIEVIDNLKLLRPLTTAEIKVVRSAVDNLLYVLEGWDDTTKNILAAMHNVLATDKSPLDKDS